jgi:hypothetical protein
MRLLLTLLGIFIAFSLAALACADAEDVGGNDTDLLDFPTTVGSQYDWSPACTC